MTAKNVINSMVTFDPGELRAYHRNPRRGNIDAIANSLEINGQYRPIVVNLGSHTGRPLEVLAGNHTLAAVKQLGWPTIQATTVDVDDLAAARIVAADNRTADLGDYDDAVLAELLQQLAADDLGLAGTGYDDEALEALLGDSTVEGLSDPDDTPEPRATAITKTGDVWLLGPHRLVCGDATDPAVVSEAVDGGLVDCYITDPPYNVSYTGGTKDALTIQNDSMGAAQFKQFLTDLFGAAFDAAAPGTPFYVFHADTEGVAFRTSLVDAGWDLKQCLVWVKQQLVLGRQDHQWQHEPVLYGWKPGAAHRWYGGRALTTLLADDQPNFAKLKKEELISTLSALYQETSVLRFDRPTRSLEHPTMKPVALLASLLDRSTLRGDLVLDTCAGSGSLLIAAHGSGRRAALVEIDPIYADVICRRFQRYTGIIPAREDTGEQVNFLDEDVAA